MKRKMRYPTITFLVSSNLAQLMEMLMKTENLTRSELARRALVYYFQKKGEKSRLV